MGGPARRDAHVRLGQSVVVAGTGGRLRARLAEVLEFSTSKAGHMSVNFARWRVRGLRLVATDMAWTSGEGPAVAGPGEAIVMAVNGRDEALRDLAGPGLATLTRRTTKWSARFASS